jgi:hypothetical protein
MLLLLFQYNKQGDYLMKTATISSIIIIVLLISVNCKITNNQETDEDLVPQLTALSPTSKAAHMPSFTLTLTGANFSPESVVVFNGQEKSITYIDSDEITCRIDPEDIDVVRQTTSRLYQDAAEDGTQFPVVVRTMSPGGGDSETLYFQVNENHSFEAPVPFLTVETLNTQPFTLPSMRIDGQGNILFSWVVDSHPDSTNPSRLFFGSAAGIDAAWTPRQLLESQRSFPVHSQLLINHQGDFFIACSSAPDYGRLHQDLFTLSSGDNGTSWSQQQQVYAVDDYIFEFNMTADHQGNLYMAWMETVYYSPDNIIYTAMSTDGGSTWSNPVMLVTGPYSANVRLSVSPTGKLYALWTEFEFTGYLFNYSTVFFSCSTDQGMTWQTPKFISNATGEVEELDAVVDDDGNISATWRWRSVVKPYSHAVCFSRSTDEGATWSPQVNLTEAAYPTRTPKITVDGAGNINIAWGEYHHKNGSSNMDIMFSRSIDNGLTWSSPYNLSNSLIDAYIAGIGVDDGGNVFLMWTQRVGNTDQIYMTTNTR